MLGLRALRPLAGRAPVQLARRRFGGGGVHDDGGGSGLAVSATMRVEMWCCFCAWHVWTDGGRGSSVVGPGEKCVCVRARARVVGRAGGEGAERRMASYCARSTRLRITSARPVADGVLLCRSCTGRRCSTHGWRR